MAPPTPALARRAGTTTRATMITRLATTAIAIRASRGSMDTMPRPRGAGGSTPPARGAIVAVRLADPVWTDPSCHVLRGAGAPLGSGPLGSGTAGECLAGPPLVGLLDHPQIHEGLGLAHALDGAQLLGQEAQQCLVV